MGISRARQVMVMEKHRQLGISGWMRASITVGDIRYSPQSLIRRNRRGTSQGLGSQARKFCAGFLNRKPQDRNQGMREAKSNYFSSVFCASVWDPPLPQN